MTNVEYSSVFRCYELLLADIVEVQLSQTQEELFRNLMEINCDTYCFVTAKEINSLGVKCEDNKFSDDIANHTHKILIENTDKLTMRKKQKGTIKVQLSELNYSNF